MGNVKIIKKLVLIVFLIGSNMAFTQKRGDVGMDSLFKELSHSKEDTNKVVLLLKISRLYVGLNPKSGFQYANNGLSLANKLNWKKGIASLNNCLGLLIGDTGNNSLAREYFEKSILFNRVINAKASLIANLNNIGRSYQREANFPKASEYFFKALEIAENSKIDEQAALVGTNLAAMYITQQDYKNGEKYAQFTIKKAESAKAAIHLAKGYEMLGIINEEKNDKVGARKNYEKALDVSRNIGNKLEEVSLLTNLANLEDNQLNQIQAQLKIKGILDEIAPTSQNSILNLANLGVSYFNLGNKRDGLSKKAAFDSSERFIKSGLILCEKTKSPEFKADILSVLANLEEARGNFKTALKSYKESTLIKDSIFSQVNKNKIANLQSQQLIDLKNKDIQNKELQISIQNKQRIFFIGGLILLVTIIGLLFWQSSTRKKTNTILLQLNNELNEANKLKSKFFGILSHDLRSPVANLISFLRIQNTQPGLLSEFQVQEHEKKITKSAEALLETMEAMLLWSKGQMSNFKPDIKNVSVESLFNELRNFFSGVPNIQFIFSDANNLFLDTDENYLRTIMQNLTSNAIQALKNNKNGNIEWKAYEENGRSIISITDNGPGVNKSQLKALYDETTVSGAKNGLGLHIIRDLAKSIHCQVDFQAQQDFGAKFVLSF